MIKLLSKNKEPADVSMADTPAERQAGAAPAAGEGSGARGGHTVLVRDLHAYYGEQHAVHDDPLHQPHARGDPRGARGGERDAG
jgi:hypothetical protein